VMRSRRRTIRSPPWMWRGIGWGRYAVTSDIRGTHPRAMRCRWVASA
jgi:hypothetical protein